VDAVTPILVERAQARGGLWSRVGFSALLHVLALPAMLFLMVARPPADQAPPVLMQISLGGAPGPRSGGMTPLAGRAAEAAPPEAKPAPAAPPAAKAPEMALPKIDAKKTPPRQTPRKAEESKARETPKAAQASEGNAVAQTGATGQAFGLTTGGGGTMGFLDVSNFCCPEYLATMMQLIQRNWNQNQQTNGDTQVKYTIQRDGRITAVEIEKPSGYLALDMSAQRALLVTKQLPPLPPQFTETTLTVHLIFRYGR
jgi:TonB family protein